MAKHVEKITEMSEKENVLKITKKGTIAITPKTLGQVRDTDLSHRVPHTKFQLDSSKSLLVVVCVTNNWGL